jgi:glycosyltransferase involved in cell wall biosynthesis
MIDIIIVNWNAGAQLRECIDSVQAFQSGYLGECVVVDNGSTDGLACAPV